MNKTPILSIIILNYNSAKYLSSCLKSIYNSVLEKYFVEIIVVDNASTDTSISSAKKIKNSNSNIVNLKFLTLNTNIGFSAGNNRGVKITNPNSKYVLFLNPDTIVNSDTLAGMINYLDSHSEIDAATCHINLASTGRLQPECHRDFPTPINAFLHFSGISSHQYFMEHLDYTQVQKINACVGAFLMVKKTVGDKINWWNEKYFFYGEDLDFAYQLKKNNYNLFFIPYYQITHFQGVSSGLKKIKTNASRNTKIRSAQATTNAMRIFYQENLINNYPPITRPLIMLGIKLLEIYRVFKAKYL